MQVNLTKLADSIYYTSKTFNEQGKNCRLRVLEGDGEVWELWLGDNTDEASSEGTMSYSYIPAHCSREESYAIAQRLISSNEGASAFIPLFERHFNSYIRTALWSSTGDDEEPLDSQYSIEDIDPESLEKQRQQCYQFISDNAQALQSITHGLDQVMHDFWLTRNGHGAGFWDGDYPEEAGNKLTQSSKTFGEVDLYVGDDGKLYFSP